MSTATAPVTAPDPVKAAKQIWLGQIIGAKELYNDSTKLKPQDESGAPVDIDALQLEITELLKTAPKDTTLIKKQLLLQNLGVPSAADDLESFNKKFEAREAALEGIRQIIQLRKNEIIEATDFEVTVQRRIEVRGKEILFGKKKVKSKSSRTEDEFSDVHHGTRVKDDGYDLHKKAVNEVIVQLRLLTEQLENNKECDFSPQELMNEMWVPLVREGLISEAQCPDEFSQVHVLFIGATKLYNKRLEAQAKKAEDKHREPRELLNDMSEVLGIGVAAVDLILSMVGGQGDVQKILGIVATCTQGAMKTATALLEQTPDMEGAASSFGDILGNVLTAALAGKCGDESAKQIGTLTKGAFIGCANLGLFAKRMSERQYESGLDFLAQAIGTALSCVGDGTELKPIQELAKHVTPALQALMKGGKIIYLFQQEPVDMTAVKTEVRVLTEKAISHSFKTVFEKTYIEKREKSGEDELGKLEKGSSEYWEKAKELDEMQEEHEELSGSIEEIFAQFSEKSSEAFESLEGAIQKKALEKGAATVEQEMLNEKELSSKRLGILFNVGVGAEGDDGDLIEEMYSIDAMIAQIERDRATLMIFNIIFDSVGGIVTAIIPQLGGIMKAKAFIMNVVAAVERSTDLITFTDMVDDARKARSPQAAPLLSEVDELRRHLRNDTQEAIIALGQAVSLSVAAAGDVATVVMGTGAVASMAGRTASAALDLYKKAKDLLKRKFEEKKTAEAWEMYKKALANPGDRLHILKTFRSNPTLAKYGIAYGAIYMDDPIAKETLRQLGLNDMVLAQESASAQKVVQFLETRFTDDIKVEGVISRFAPDGGDPLSLSGWLKNKEAAQAEINIEKWKPQDTRALDAAFHEAETNGAEARRMEITTVSPAQWDDAFGKWKAYYTSLEGLKKQLEKFKPLNTKDEPFSRFENYINELIVQINKQREEMVAKVKLRKDSLDKMTTASTKDLRQVNDFITLLTQDLKVLKAKRKPDLISMKAFVKTGGDVDIFIEKLKTLAGDNAEFVRVVANCKFQQQSAERLASKGTVTDVGKKIDELMQELDDTEKFFSAKLGSLTEIENELKLANLKLEL